MFLDKYAGRINNNGYGLAGTYRAPGICLNTSCYLDHKRSHKVHAVIPPTWQVRKKRRRESKLFAQSHSVSR